jgi:hypothetical protein
MKNRKFVFTIYGFDPYNTADADKPGVGLQVGKFHGPLGALAYRSQRNWDFLPGLSADEKIKHWGRA